MKHFDLPEHERRLGRLAAEYLEELPISQGIIGRHTLLVKVVLVPLPESHTVQVLHDMLVREVFSRPFLERMGVPAINAGRISSAVAEWLTGPYNRDTPVKTMGELCARYKPPKRWHVPGVGRMCSRHVRQVLKRFDLSLKLDVTN